ncbi:MAG TPA: hypothetical protein VHX88_03260 [Solirubrobacteraceae bacterium]|jgi:hypothetical protein|nr:hypothetical protein [Solirubrobacteraceae bacterium]
MPDPGAPPIGVNRRVQLICAWCGPIFMVMLAIGLLFIAGLVPPPSPSDSAAHVAAFYRDHRGQVRAGLLICLAGTPLLAPFVALISYQLKRSDPDLAPFADVQLMCGVVLLMLFLIPELMLAVAVFRTNGSPQVTRTLNDISWTTFVWTFSFPVVEYGATGLAILMDRSRIPLYPRWVGIAELAIAVLFIPGAPTIWVMHGPFSWRGALAFWLVFAAFGVWIFMMFFCQLRAIDRQAERFEQASVAPAS